MSHAICNVWDRSNIIYAMRGYWVHTNIYYDHIVELKWTSKSFLFEQSINIKWKLFPRSFPCNNNCRNSRGHQISWSADYSSPSRKVQNIFYRATPIKTKIMGVCYKFTICDHQEQNNVLHFSYSQLNISRSLALKLFLIKAFKDVILLLQIEVFLFRCSR